MSIFEKFGKYAKKFQFLSKEEEVELITACQKNNDKKAEERLFGSHVHFILKYVSKSRLSNERNMEDILSVAYTGFIISIYKFDLNRKDVRLSTYSTFWMKQYVSNYHYDNYNNVKFSRTYDYRKVFNKISKATAKLGITHKQYLSDEDIENVAKEIDVKPHYVKETLQRLGKDFSLNVPLVRNSLVHEGHYEFIDLIPSNDESIENILVNDSDNNFKMDMLNKAMSVLNHREKDILKMNVCNERTLEEIGKKYKISRERARQIREKALGKLRNQISLQETEINAMVNNNTQNYLTM